MYFDIIISLYVDLNYIAHWCCSWFRLFIPYSVSGNSNWLEYIWIVSVIAAMAENNYGKIVSEASTGRQDTFSTVG